MTESDLSQLERALLDVTRVALDGDVEGVRLLCRRYTRRVPLDASHPSVLKDALLGVLARSTKPADSPLRSADAVATVATDHDASWVQHPAALPAPVLSSGTARVIRLLVAEHLDPTPLEKLALSPSKAVLFAGPSGVGKTLTARYVASELGLPLITVNLASLISSLMGRTGQNLQEVMDLAAAQPCVVFFDEFDALAKSRSDSSDVGEVRRLVNVILQQLDRWPTGGLLVAATNHAPLLDQAVHRRFDMTVQFDVPDRDTRQRLLSQNVTLKRLGANPEDLDVLSFVSEGWSHAEIETWVNRTVRRAVLDDRNAKMDVVNVLLEGVEPATLAAISRTPDMRQRLALLASTRLKWSNRRVAEWLGVSHPTIAADIARERAREIASKETQPQGDQDG